MPEKGLEVLRSVKRSVSRFAKHHFRLVKDGGEIIVAANHPPATDVPTATPRSETA